MSDSTDKKCAETCERQARDRLLRHYQQIGAPAIAAALDAVKRADAEKGAGERQGAMPSFLLSDDHAA